MSSMINWCAGNDKYRHIINVKTCALFGSINSNRARDFVTAGLIFSKHLLQHSRLQFPFPRYVNHSVFLSLCKRDFGVGIQALLPVFYLNLVLFQLCMCNWFCAHLGQSYTKYNLLRKASNFSCDSVAIRSSSWLFCKENKKCFLKSADTFSLSTILTCVTNLLLPFSLPNNFFLYY